MRRGSFSPVSRLIHAILAIAWCLLLPGSAWCDVINYSVQVYGSRHAVINFSGPGSESLSVTPSNNGNQLRVSGVNVQFSTGQKSSGRGIIGSVRQVQRGAFTDLVIGFNIPISVSATPGSGNLKLIIKGKPQSQPPSLPKETPVDSTVTTASQASYPVQVISQLPEKGAKPSGLTIVFPDLSSLTPRTSLAQFFFSSGRSIEILWAFATGQQLTLNDSSRPPAKDMPSKEDAEDIDALVTALTQELVELRTELMEKNKEITELRAWKSTKDRE